MPVQIYRRQSNPNNSIGDAILAGTQGLLQGRKLRTDADQNSIANALRIAQVQELQRKTAAYDQAPQTGSPADPAQPLIMIPGKGLSKNPQYLNPLEQKKLDALEEKKQQAATAEENKSEMLRQDAEGQLAAIQEAKKGKKYFGPMGNLPSIAAPSSVVGEYGQRKEWENNVNKLLSGRVIDVMNKMKQASKTGATGFGQLNKSELALIQNASNVLSKDLPPDIAEKYLNDLEPIYRKVLGQEITTTSGPGYRQTSADMPINAGSRPTLPRTQNRPNANLPTTKQTARAFPSEQAALASGVKGQVFINGRPAVIE